MVPCKSTAKENLFKWSCHRILLPTDSKMSPQLTLGVKGKVKLTFSLANCLTWGEWGGGDFTCPCLDEMLVHGPPMVTFSVVLCLHKNSLLPYKINDVFIFRNSKKSGQSWI